MSEVKTRKSIENNKLLDKAKWVIFSREFFWIATIVMALLAILQFILFFSNITIINGTKFQEIINGEVSTSHSTIVFARLFLSGIGGVTATLGLLLINRGDKKFYYFSITTAILLTLNGFISNLFFEGCKWLVVGIILAINAIIWNIESIEIKPKRVKVIYSIIATLLIILIMSLIGLFGVSQIPEESPFYNSMPVLDPTQFGLTVTGNVLMIFKIAESRIIYGVGNLFTIFMFAGKTIKGDLVSLSQVFQGILYLIVTCSGFVLLINEVKNNKGE